MPTTSIATGAKHTAHFIAEVTYGITPATPAFIPVPITAISIGMTKDAIEAGKLRADRQVEDLRHGNKNVAGDVTGELEYGAYDDLIEAVMLGTWSTDVLKVGLTSRSFTFERFFDIDTDEYHRSVGVQMNSMNISVSPNSMVGVTFGVIGKDLTANTSQIAGATYGADVGNQPFDSFTGTITEGGSTIATVTALEMTVENGIEPTFVLMDDTTICPPEGKMRLTGTLTAYFDDKTLYEKFLNETVSELVLTLTDDSAQSLQFDVPNLKYTAGNPDVSGDGPVTIALEFTGLFSSGDASTLVITRTP